MKSARTRLIVVFILAMTLTLGIFGAYSQLQLSQDLEARYAQIKSGAVNRLSIGLQIPTFNFDKTAIDQVIQGEMLSREVQGIYVFGATGSLISGIRRSDKGTLVHSNAQSDTTGEPIQAVIKHDGLAEGKFVVYFSRALIDQTLNAQTSHRMIEVLVVDVLLIVILTLSLRMVFGPLKHLRDALFGLASDTKEYVEELPDPKVGEFSEVVTGFNMTLRKLRTVIVRSHEAEAEVTDALGKLKKMQEELISAEKLAGLGSLVAGVAHELNTPLGNGLMAVTTLEDALDEFKQTVETEGYKKSAIQKLTTTSGSAAGIVRRSLERSARLVVSFKKVAVNRTQMRRSEFNLLEIVTQTLISLDPELHRERYSISVDISPEIKLDSYPESLGEVIACLVSNAIIHGFNGREHGSILISAAQEESMLAIRVIDDGRGIEPQHLKKVFDPFFTTRLGKGESGLGLHIAHNTVAKVLGGRLELTSTVGAGSTFTLRIPFVAPDN